MRLHPRQSGFVLADLTVSGIIGILIAGIIAVLISLIVAPLQQARERSNLEGDPAAGKPGAIQTTLVLRRYATLYQARFGAPAASVGQIATACAAQAVTGRWDDCDVTYALYPGFWDRLVDGKDGGFIYFWDAANGRMEGWPAAPGLTAAKTVVSFDGQSHALLDTPGADAARAAAFAAFRARAGDVIGALLSVEPAQPLVIRDTGLNVAAGDVCGDFIGDIISGYADADANGVISGAEAGRADSLALNGIGTNADVTAARSSLQSALSALAEAFAYGAGDEDTASFGIAVADTAACSAAAPRSVYYNYANLESLTRAYVADDNVEARLIQHLRDARREAAAGNVIREQQSLQAFVDGVEDQGVFQWITRNHQLALKVHAQATASAGVTLQ